jgi:hypothetical protein
VVSGIEYQVDALGDRLENIAFAKHYYQRQVTEVLAGQSALGDRRTQRAGFGDGVRYRFRDWLYAKASYEWATRLPRPDEVFGDNAFVAANPLLVPESSHNLNLGVTVDDVHTSAGVLGASATGVLREIDRLISPLPSNEFVTYENVYGARSIGIEAAASWKSPGDYLAIDGAASYLEFRNNDSAGEFGAFKGDRIPDQPYLFASGSARVTLRELVLPRDQITLSFGSRYVHSFFRSWESIGLHDSKQTIPSQLVHSIGLGYRVRRGGVGFSTTIEVSNVTDEAVFDFYGLQRPGRALYVKTALDF